MCLPGFADVFLNMCISNWENVLFSEGVLACKIKLEKLKYSLKFNFFQNKIFEN